MAQDICFKLSDTARTACNKYTAAAEMTYIALFVRHYQIKLFGHCLYVITRSNCLDTVCTSLPDQTVWTLFVRHYQIKLFGHCLYVITRSNCLDTVCTSLPDQTVWTLFVRHYQIKLFGYVPFPVLAFPS